MLDYIGYKEAAKFARLNAELWSSVPVSQAVKCLEEFLRIYVPQIAQPVVYGHKRNGRPKKSISLEVLALERDHYPWLVFLTFQDRGTYHAFVLIDDVVFDTSTPKALQRNMEAIRYILGNSAEAQHIRHYRFPCVQKSLLEGHEPFRSREGSGSCKRKRPMRRAKKKTRWCSELNTLVGQVQNIAL